MKNNITKKKRKPRSSKVTIVISISMVLFLLGLMGLLILNAQKLSDHIKEKFEFSVFLNDNASEAEIKKLQKLLDATDFVKISRYVSKKEAANEFKTTLGEDFVELIGQNPLLASLEIKLHAEYANTDSLIMIENKITAYPEVKEVYYQKNLVHLVNENMRIISIVILFISAVLLLISFTLINNTIRLSIFSQRFYINTMQLVGAKDTFIRKPYVNKGIIYGFIASLIAIGLILGIVFFIQMELENLIYLTNLKILVVLFSSLIIIGIVFAWFATHVAVNLYLRKKISDLY